MFIKTYFRVRFNYIPQEHVSRLHHFLSSSILQPGRRAVGFATEGLLGRQVLGRLGFVARRVGRASGGRTLARSPRLSLRPYQHHPTQAIEESATKRGLDGQGVF